MEINQSSVVTSLVHVGQSGTSAHSLVATFQPDSVISSSSFASWCAIAKNRVIVNFSAVVRGAVSQLRFRWRSTAQLRLATVRCRFNKLLKCVPGAKTAPSTGQPPLRFGFRLAKRYAYLRVICPNEH